MRPCFVVLLVAVGSLVGACSGTHEPHVDRAVPLVREPVVKKEPSLDVPALIGLSIDEVSRRVGPRLPVPASFADPVLVSQALRQEALDSTALFQASGVTMVAAYDQKSREVRDLLLLGSNENELMSRARLQLGAENYLVLPVFQSQRPTQLMGLRVLAVSLNQ